MDRSVRRLDAHQNVSLTLAHVDQGQSWRSRTANAAAISHFKSAFRNSHAQRNLEHCLRRPGWSWRVPCCPGRCTQEGALEKVKRPDSLGYQAFGEKAGLVRIMDDFMVGLLADSRTKPFFENADQAREGATGRSVCFILGGPCEYKGAKMKPMHANLASIANSSTPWSNSPERDGQEQVPSARRTSC